MPLRGTAQLPRCALVKDVGLNRARDQQFFLTRGIQLSTKKAVSTLSEVPNDIATRVSDTPMIKPSDVPPSHSKLEVIGVLNPTFIEIQGKKYLITRVDERPSGISTRAECAVIDKEPFLVAYADLEYPGKLEVIETNIKKNSLYDHDPILPEAVRDYCIATRQQNLLLSYISHLRIFELFGSEIIVNDSPIVYPSDVFSKYGCEDPRATVIDGQPVFIYTAIGPYGATSWLARMKNKSIGTKKMILGPDHKHSTIFPTRIGGSYYLLTRPLSRSYLRTSGIWILESPDMIHWGAPVPVLLPRPGEWDSVRVGPSASPILIDNGWLLFYYGVDFENTYRMGAALLARDNPSKVIARTIQPVLSPALEWERNGRRADTVFSCGTQWLVEEDTLRIYYGAADTSVGAADIKTVELMNQLC